MDPETAKKEVAAAMGNAVDHMLQEFVGVRTGKASPSLVENLEVHVESYGSKMRLKELAVINTPEARTIMVQPFDPSVTSDIERAIRENGKLGLNPVSDGKVIRLPIPELTEERRVELVKVIRNMAEESRIRVRASRKDGMDGAKKMKADNILTEDQARDFEGEVQDFTDSHIKEIDEKLAEKEQELMTV
ncbi:MAG: ribosome recycling factor [Roseibacillus sp.]|nr:ribosome recycling factor [Roseibacillus sp.]